MFWGGEYQQEMRTVAPHRRADHLNRIQQHTKPLIEPPPPNNAISSNNNSNNNSGKPGTGNGESPTSQEPKIDFRVIAGAPLRSKCQWARVIVRGKGPLKRALNNRDYMNSFNIFDNWNRFYLSLDEFGLHLFENKFLSTPFYMIPADEFRHIRVELGFPIRESMWDIQSGIDLVTRVIHGNANNTSTNGAESGDNINNNNNNNNNMSPTRTRRMQRGPSNNMNNSGGQNTANSGNNSGDKAVLEDIHNVILTTTTGDEVYMRYDNQDLVL
jgi:hypothetical protein